MHLRGAVSGRCATIPENRRAPYREVVRGSRCRLAGVDASMGQRLLDLLGSLQTLATVASTWIEIVALQPKTVLGGQLRRSSGTVVLRCVSTRLLKTGRGKYLMTRPQRRGAARRWSRVGKVSRGVYIQL